MKNVIDKKLSSPNTAYNPVPAANYFNKIKSEISSKAFHAPEFSEGQMINEFRADEVQRLPYNKPASPSTPSNSSTGLIKPQAVPQATYTGSPIQTTA